MMRRRAVLDITNDARIAEYLSTLSSLPAPGGRLLNHGISSFYVRPALGASV